MSVITAVFMKFRVMSVSPLSKIPEPRRDSCDDITGTLRALTAQGVSVVREPEPCGCPAHGLNTILISEEQCRRRRLHEKRNRARLACHVGTSEESLPVQRPESLRSKLAVPLCRDLRNRAP
jgi:hypothetical protein